MYEFIAGTIRRITPKYIVLENNGIGYLVFVPNPYNFKLNEFREIWIYQQVRDDGIFLYGLETSEAKELFLKLISVTGIGPKTALPILAAASVEEITGAISSGNSGFMQKFPGIGPKAAQQIILDLRGKVEMQEEALFHNDLADCEEALIALGYNKKDVNKALIKVDKTKPTNDIIKQALKVLSKL